VDEISTDRFLKLSFNEFLEAISRVAFISITLPLADVLVMICLFIEFLFS